MLNKRAPLLLLSLITAGCSISHNKYTFVLCQINGSEVIGYNSVTKSGGGYDHYGFPVVSCTSSDMLCMSFPFYFALPSGPIVEGKSYNYNDFIISFENDHRAITVDFEDKKANIRATSTYDKREGLTKYIIYQDGPMYQYRKCKGRFYMKDLPRAV